MCLLACNQDSNNDKKQLLERDLKKNSFAGLKLPSFQILINNILEDLFAQLSNSVHSPKRKQALAILFIPQNESKLWPSKISFLCDVRVKISFNKDFCAFWTALGCRSTNTFFFLFDGLCDGPTFFVGQWLRTFTKRF